MAESERAIQESRGQLFGKLVQNPKALCWAMSSQQGKNA